MVLRFRLRASSVSDGRTSRQVAMAWVEWRCCRLVPSPPARFASREKFCFSRPTGYFRFMKISLLSLSGLAAGLCLALGAGNGWAQPAAGTAAAKTAAATVNGRAMEPATRSTPTNWMERHEGFVKLAKAGGIDVLF